MGYTVTFAGNKQNIGRHFAGGSDGKILPAIYVGGKKDENDTERSKGKV